MVDDDPPDYLDDKDEGTRRRITRRVGERLSIENLPDAERLAGEALARELVSDAIEHVRAEFANAVRHARYLPQDIALKIAHDVDSVAGPFLEVTEVFSEAEWQRLVRTISLTSRVTVARRASLTEGVVIALAEIGDAVVVEALIENPDAPLTEQVCYLIVDRFADQTAVLDQLAQRDSLGAEIALDLVAKVSATVRAMLTKKYNLGGGGKRLAIRRDRDRFDPGIGADETEIASILALVRKALQPRSIFSPSSGPCTTAEGLRPMSYCGRCVRIYWRSSRSRSRIWPKAFPARARKSCSPRTRIRRSSYSVPRVSRR